MSVAFEAQGDGARRGVTTISTPPSARCLGRARQQVSRAARRSCCAALGRGVERHQVNGNAARP